MTSIAPAHIGMLFQFRIQPAQLLNPKMTAVMVEQAIASGPAWGHAGREANSTRRGADHDPRSGCDLGVLSDSIGASMTPIHRIVRHTLEVLPFRRLEAHVDVEHAEAHRWIALLGFEQEGVMRQFYEGRDFALYARVKHG